MAQPAGIEDRDLLHSLEILLVCGLIRGEAAVFSERCLQPLPDFKGFPGLQADFFRALAMCEDLGFKVQAVAGQCSQGIGRFQVDEVFGSLGGAEFRLGVRAPAVGLGAEISYFAHRCIRPQKSWNLSRQSAGSQLVDHAMAFAAPAETGYRGKKNKSQRAGGKATKKVSTHRAFLPWM